VLLASLLLVKLRAVSRRVLQRLSSVVLVVSRCDPEYVDSLRALVSTVVEEPELAVVSLPDVEPELAVLPLPVVEPELAVVSLPVVDPELAVVSLLVVEPEPAVVDPLLVVVPVPDVLLVVVVELAASHAPL